LDGGQREQHHPGDEDGQSREVEAGVVALGGVVQ